MPRSVAFCRLSMDLDVILWEWIVVWPHEAKEDGIDVGVDKRDYETSVRGFMLFTWE